MAIEQLTDEIIEIIDLGYEDTIDIETDGNHLFFANDILTHNCSIEEVEFDHSHIAGGLSKIQTADNVFGIFTSKAMRDRGQYQIQLMKTRNSSGVGSKFDLAYNVDTLRITDFDNDAVDNTISKSSFLDQIKNRNTTQGASTAEAPKIKAEVNSSKLRDLLNTLPEDD